MINNYLLNSTASEDEFMQKVLHLAGEGVLELMSIEMASGSTDLEVVHLTKTRNEAELNNLLAHI